MTTPPPAKRKPTTATGVICRNCGGIHFFSGSSEPMVPIRHLSDKYSIWCQKDGSWHDYELNDEETVYREEPVSNAFDNEGLVTRIIEVENRLAKLETKTAELPERDGIKELKSNFVGFLTDALKASGKDVRYTS